MRPRRRGRTYRTSRMEPMEPRIVPSGSAALDFAADYAEVRPLAAAQSTPADVYQLTGLSSAGDLYGLDGRGQTVAIIDSGVAYTHTALGGGFGPGFRVVGGYDFTGTGDADPYDTGPYGAHGTHVAGILASTDGTAPGIATGVDLVALRVFDDAGQGQVRWVEQALAWVHQHRNDFRYPITTVNLSLGSQWNGDDPPAGAAWEDELAQLQADGIFVAVAAGNGFVQYGESGLGYPAASPYVVPVSSVDADGQLSYFSQRSERAIAAPGRSILSTVPDYLGNRNGVDDDFARFSGTSMAAPYVAGASVLVRQAYEFVGVPNVSQSVLYNLMYSTADVIHDAATNQDYRRLNLQRALAAVMPEDEYASTAAAAYQWGTIADTLSLSGTIGQLDDRDYFTFTAAASGRVTIAAAGTHQLQADWDLLGAERQPAADNDSSLSFLVEAGRSYTVGLGTEAGIGHYTLTAKLQASSDSPEVAPGLQQTWADMRVTAAGQWIRVTAARDGILTLDARFANSRGDVDLELFDAQQQLLRGSYGTGDSERIDVNAAAGEQFYVHAYLNGSGANADVDLRLTNMVALQGTTLVVAGTPGDDQFAFSAGAVRQMTANGVTYEFAASQVRSVRLYGLAGSDRATLTGSAGSDTAVLRPGSAELTGAGYEVQAQGIENLVIRGGGGDDTASLYDSPGNDTFTASPGTATLAGAGFASRVDGFSAVHVYAKAGGLDTADLFDSARDDVFVATPQYGKLFGPGYLLRAKFFDAVHAHAQAGGRDTARFDDSGGNDLFVGTPVSAELSGRGFSNRADAFDEVIVRATAGGRDTAQLSDSPGDDRLLASARAAQLLTPLGSTQVIGFDRVQARGESGGTNTSKVAAIDFLLDLLGRW